MELKELDEKKQVEEEESPKEKDKLPLLNSVSGEISSDYSGTIEELERKCAAYVRKDVHGTMGCGEVPLQERLLIGFALLTLVPIRFFAGIVLVLFYYVVCRVCTLFSEPNPDEDQGDYAHMVGWRRAVIVRCGRFLSRGMLFVMGFYWIKETSHDGDESERPGVIISNHVSYLDILYHMSSSFPSFVAKRSVARLPLVGLISKCMGCVYVQREAKSSDSKGVSGVVTERIQKAYQNKQFPLLMLFPEGTTTNGEYLLPFKTGAFLAKSPLLPVLLRYPYERFSPAWDSISGVRHLILLLCQFVNHLEVAYLPVYCPSEHEKEDPRLYANNVRKLMATEGDLILSDIGLSEKRIYHAALKASSLRRFAVITQRWLLFTQLFDNKIRPHFCSRAVIFFLGIFFAAVTILALFL